MKVPTMKLCLIQAEDFNTILNLTLGVLILLIESGDKFVDVFLNDTEEIGITLEAH